MPPRPPIARYVPPAEIWLHKLRWPLLAAIPCAVAALVWTVGNWQSSYLAQIEARKVEANTVAEVVAQ